MSDDPEVEIMQLLALFYTPADADRWLHTAQPILNGSVPIDLIRQGDACDVLDVLRGMESGVYL